jgi:hypothetical protein
VLSVVAGVHRGNAMGGIVSGNDITIQSNIVIAS